MKEITEASASVGLLLATAVNLALRRSSIQFTDFVKPVEVQEGGFPKS